MGGSRNHTEECREWITKEMEKDEVEKLKRARDKMEEVNTSKREGNPEQERGVSQSRGGNVGETGGGGNAERNRGGLMTRKGRRNRMVIY